MEPNWLNWVRRLQAIAQSGRNYTENAYDRERYEQLERIAAEICALHTQTDVQPIMDLFRGEVGYATPKVEVRGAVFRDDSLLLVQEKADENRWTLPGGWAEVGEPPSLAVVREVYEETGYTVVPKRLVGVFDSVKQNHPPFLFHVYKLFFYCEIAADADDGAIMPYEAGESAFFTQAEIPSDLSPGRITSAQIKRIFEHHYQPHLPTYFD